MIKRFTPYLGYEYNNLLEEEVDGEYVLFKDYITVLEELEYDLRYYREEIDSRDETVQELIEEVVKYKDLTIELQAETSYWKDLYNELYEQTN